MIKRENKKGFTIVELVVVMGIIVVVAASSVVAYTRMTTSYKDKEYDRLISEFEAAAETYVAINKSIREIVYSGSGYATVTLKLLREAGLVDDDAADPVTGERFDDKFYVSVYLDETKNLHAVFMRESTSSFTNSRAKQSVLAGTIYTRVQMLEYIIGYTRGEYNASDASYGTHEIDYSRVIVQVHDVTDPNEYITVSNTKIDTTQVGKKYRIDYSYDFGNKDGVKTLVREIEIYDLKPTISLVKLQPDALSSYTKEDVVVIVSAESLHKTLKYHYVINGRDVESENASMVLTENGLLNVYVETPYGMKSDTFTTTVSYIDKFAPTRTITVRERDKYEAYIEISELMDNDSGLPSEPVFFSGTQRWSSDNIFKITRNGTYTFKFKDNVGNEDTESVTITNIVLENFIGLEKEDIRTMCNKYKITCNFAGSSSIYAYATYQSISAGTPITDGMTVNITMEQPQNSVALTLKNTGLKDSPKNLIFSSSSDEKQIELEPAQGYYLDNSSISCTNTVTASITDNVLTISNSRGNATCTITAKKMAVGYDE